MDFSRYRFGRALRPFSFCVVLVGVGLGILLAYAEGFTDSLRAALIFAAGLLLQAGVNLINDHADLRLPPGVRPTGQDIQLIVRNTRIGSVSLLTAALISCYLVVQTGWSLLLLCLLGAVGAVGYTVEPINYKRRGLGVPVVFWMMGVLLVCGAYLAMSGQWSLKVSLLAVPVSLLTALLLLSNELRDWETDCRHQICTLTVRWGYGFGCRLYLGLIALAYLVAAGLHVQGLLPQWLPLLLSLPLLRAPILSLRGGVASRRQLPPATGRFFSLFGALYILCALDVFPRLTG